MQLSWSDPRLSVARDSHRAARYRLLQSWYREKVLHAAYGEYRVGTHTRPLGSLLAVSELSRRPGLNFVTDTAARYARERAIELMATGQGIDITRHSRDMLSSVAMAISIFGELRAREDRGLDVVRTYLDPYAVAVAEMECVWRPDVDVLGDRSGFDVAVITEREDGSRHLVGIEVKYAERFDQTIYNSDDYRRVHRNSGWFHPGPATPLLGPATNQLWRTLLLAAACGRFGVMNVSSASVVVLCAGDDPDAPRALTGVRAALREPDECCRMVSLEALVAGARSGAGAGAQWADAFARRYLEPPEMYAELPDINAETLGL